MVSKNQIKLIRQLELKKHRQALGLFVAEGPKVVEDLLTIMRPHSIFATSEWAQRHPQETVHMVLDSELQKLSLMQHPQQVLALFPMPQNDGSLLKETALSSEKELVMVLDGVQDPGNVGTIIRLCDWFGITRVVCGLDCADAFSPKTIQATMGSIARVKVMQTDLQTWCAMLPQNTPIYGTLLDGDNIYEKEISNNGVIIMGNEGNGLSAAVRQIVTDRLLIPSYPPHRTTAESLNVAMATAIICAEFRRSSYTKQ